MRVGLIEKPGVLKIAERDMPKIINSTDVLIRVKRVGICGSDMHISHGKNPFAVYPRVWGHEFTGEVAEAGAAVTKVKKGSHVVVEPIIYCGECYACRQGRGNVCEHLQVMGVHIDGGCQEYIVVPEANAHIVPGTLPWDEAVLVEPFTIGAQACYRGNVQKGDVVLVFGAGTIGLAAAQLAKLYGATVIVTDLVDEKLDYAKSRGADYVINAGKTDMMAEVRRITGGMGSNVTVDAVCNKKSLEDAVEITSTAGRVVNLSFNETASEIVPKLVTQKELTICGSRLQTKRFPVVIDFFVKGAIPVKGFVNKTFPLSEMLAAFKYVDDNGAAVRKVVINME